MKQSLGLIGDPSLHLIALTTVLMGAFVVFNAPSWLSHRGKGSAHPPGCHACSVSLPEAAAARDAYLTRNGSIQAPGDTE